MKMVHCDDGNFIKVDGTAECRFDNLWWHQSRQSSHHYDPQFNNGRYHSFTWSTLIIICQTNGTCSHCVINNRWRWHTFPLKNLIITWKSIWLYKKTQIRLYKLLKWATMVLVFSLLDFSKAFDTVDHDILPDKFDHHGIRGCAFSWFKGYLSCRTQYARYNGN